jgi:hypothetical protein
LHCICVSRFDCSKLTFMWKRRYCYDVITFSLCFVVFEVPLRVTRTYSIILNEFVARIFV